MNIRHYQKVRHQLFEISSFNVFKKIPLFRVSARKLLKHPWISGTNTKKPANTAEDIGATTKFEDAVRSVQQWNEAIKSPSGGAPGEARVVQGQNITPSLQRTNLRAGVVAGVTMTPPKFRESVIDKHISGEKTDPFRSPESSRMSLIKWLC